MEFSVNRNYFLEQLSTVSRAIPVHSPMPILTGVFIQVFDDRLVLTGSNSEMTIQTTILPGELSQLKIEHPGAMAVDARILTDLLRKMQGTILKADAPDDTMLHLSTTDGNFDLVGFDGREYPEIDLRQPEKHIQLPASLLSDISTQISYAASQKDSRAILLGVHLEAKNGVLTAAATDSYRLARKVCPIESEEDFIMTIPVNALNEALHTFEKEENVDMYLDNRKVQMISGKTLIQSQLYEGNYPDVSRIIPSKYISSLEVNSAQLEGALARTMVYSTPTQAEKTALSPVRMECSPNGVFTNVLTTRIGQCRQELTDSIYQGQDLAISYNGKLVLDALKALNCQDKVIVEFTGELSPIRLTNPDDPTLTMIVVPIRSN